MMARGKTGIVKAPAPMIGERWIKRVSLYDLGPDLTFQFTRWAVPTLIVTELCPGPANTLMPLAVTAKSAVRCVTLKINSTLTALTRTTGGTFSRVGASAGLSGGRPQLPEHLPVNIPVGASRVPTLTLSFTVGRGKLDSRLLICW